MSVCKHGFHVIPQEYEVSMIQTLILSPDTRRLDSLPDVPRNILLAQYLILARVHE